jgi:hypothetical protein
MRIWWPVYDFIVVPVALWLTWLPVWLVALWLTWLPVWLVVTNLAASVASSSVLMARLISVCCLTGEMCRKRARSASSIARSPVRSPPARRASTTPEKAFSSDPTYKEHVNSVLLSCYQFSDSDPHGIRIRWPPGSGSGSVFWMRIRIQEA